MPQIAQADSLIVGTPVYMLQVNGVTKNFLDRLYPFLTADLTARHLPGKKYITVTCSGAPAVTFNSVTDYLNELLGGWFKMENAGNIIAGKVNEKDDIIGQPEILNRAEDIGRKLG